ncbi:ATP-dependent nuclease [Burkholderia plantarii]|uniref:ATP-dependent nuclease n=1 Tax=Burkholderia plantarii TaxID=41899 RepID=UPI000705E7B4|nr:ATP-binding protein [Burkholderia plantarii]ALK34386.1 ATP-dependent OLD family endonuclease [Burkholderia plantarii]
MRLDEVIIHNYCSCSAVRVPLSSFNPIIGYNNSGKSNILRAISWLLRKSVLPAHAFYDPATAVMVEGLISETNINLLPANQRTQIDPYIVDGKLRFRRRQDIPNAPAAQIRVDVFNPAIDQWVVNPTGLDNAIGVLFPDPLYIEAMDDAANDISRFAARNTIGLLLKYTLDQIRANNAAALNNVLTDLQSVGAHLNGPTRIQELNTLEGDATQAIGDFFPGLSLHLDIEAPSFDDLIKGAAISLSDTPGLQRPFTSFGHGAQRTVQMALIKLLASQINQQAAAGSITVLLIDEPELYLHPQAIELLRESLKLLSQQNFQVVFSTHSPLLLGIEDVLNTSMVYKTATNGTVVRDKLANATHMIATNPHQASVIFSIQHATYLMFSETVLLVEGKTEMMILPALYKTITGRTIVQDKACLVSGSSSSSIPPMMQVLRAVGFAPKAVVDLDFAFKVGPQAGLISNTDADFIACHAWFAANQPTVNFELGTDGFPARKSATGVVAAVGPEEAFRLMAAAMPGEVARLCAIFRTHGIWVWGRGAIEAHLGIQKNDPARMAFVGTMQANGNASHAAHEQDLIDFAAWI